MLQNKNLMLSTDTTGAVMSNLGEGKILHEGIIAAWAEWLGHIIIIKCSQKLDQTSKTKKKSKTRFLLR